MSDRDKKIILVLLIIAVVALPYVFVIKEKRIETETVKAGNIELQARLDHLKELETQRDFYIEKTEENNKERDKIIASFPADIRQENYTMFLYNTERVSTKLDDENNEIVEYPIAFQEVTYGENVETPISDPESGTELNYTAISNSSTLGYQTFYGGFKYYLEYLKSYQDPMSYVAFSAEMDEETGIISGEIVLNQYAISGEGRTLKDVEIKPEIDNEHRGVIDKGVFGVPDQILPGEDENADQQQIGENMLDQQNTVVIQ